MSTGTTPKISEHSNTVLGWLTLLTLGALVLAFIHAELYTVYGPFLKIRDWSPIPTWAVWVRRVRWPVRFGALASLLTLLYFELRWNHVTRSFERFTAHRMGLIVVLAAMGALSGMYYLLPGYLQAAAANGDYYMHMAWLVLDTLRAGQLPIWSNWGDMGFPLMQFYSPLLFVSLAVTNVVIPNIWIATKWFFFGLHIASVFAMFAYANRLTRSRFAALTAALAYGIAFYRYHTIVYLNKFVMGPTFVLWPLQLYFVERIITGKSNLRSGVGLALATAAGLVSHIYFGFFAALFTFAYAAIRLWSVRPSRAEMWNTGKRLVIWFAAGVMASLFYTLPAALESDLTVLSGWYPGGYISFGEGFAPETLAAVFTFEGSQGPLWTYGYVGNSLLLLTVVGAATALVRRQLYALAPLVLLALSLFMALGPVTALFSAQGQFVVYAFVMAAAGVGIFVAELERGAPGALPVRVKINWSRTRTIALVGLFIGADMLRYTLFLNYLVPPSPLGSPPERATAHQWLIEHHAEIQGRLLDPDQPENGWQIPMVAGIPTFQNNGDSSVYSAILTRNLRPNSPNPLNIRPYSAEELFGDAFGLLLIANVDYVIVDGPSPLAERPGAVTTEDGAVLVPTDGGLPMLASRAARVVEPLLQLAPLANEIQIARERAAAAFLPVRETAPALDSASATSGPLKLQVSEHHMEGQYVRLDYTLSDAAYVQLSYGYYPYLRVSIDGVEVEKFPTTFGLIGVVSPGGRHTIEIVPYLSPLRKVVGVVNLGALLLLAALFAASFRRKRV